MFILFLLISVFLRNLNRYFYLEDSGFYLKNLKNNHILTKKCDQLLSIKKIMCVPKKLGEVKILILMKIS